MNSDRLSELIGVVENKYGIRINTATNYRGSIIIVDEDGYVYILKHVDCDEPRLKFSHEVELYIHQHGYTNCELVVPYYLQNSDLVKTESKCRQGGFEQGSKPDLMFGLESGLESCLGTGSEAGLESASVSVTELESESVSEIVSESNTNALHEHAPSANTTSDGEIIPVFSFPDRDNKWVLCKHIHGRESNFEDDDELEKICTSLARMHLASRGFSCSDTQFAQSGNINKLGKMPASYGKRLAELEKLRKKAMKERREFDIEYMNNAPTFIEWGEKAFELVNTPAYALLVRDAALTGGISHCDLTYQNILIDEQDQPFFTGFESACFELHVYDLANLIRRKMRKCDWDFDAAMRMVGAYDRVNSLSDKQLIALKGILLFPQKFWRIANRYYNMNKAWTHRSMKEKLLEAVAERECFSRFAKQLLEI